jgi:TRAP-type transport system small permease protein
MTKLSFVEMVLGRYLPTIMRYILVVSSISLSILIFAQVWLRYVFQLPLLWVEEVAVTPAFWMYMTGAAYAAYDRSHIRVGVVDVAIRNARRRLTVQFIASAITLGLAVLFLIWGFNFFMEDLRFGPQTATLRYPLIYARSSFFLSAGILGGLYFMVETIDLARQLFWHKAPLELGGK